MNNATPTLVPTGVVGLTMDLAHYLADQDPSRHVHVNASVETQVMAIASKAQAVLYHVKN